MCVFNAKLIVGFLNGNKKEKIDKSLQTEKPNSILLMGELEISIYSNNVR